MIGRPGTPDWSNIETVTFGRKKKDFRFCNEKCCYIYLMTGHASYTVRHLIGRMVI